MGNVKISDNKYVYRAFGLNIISDFKLSGLMPGEGNIDISIINGKVPEKIIGQNEDYLYSSKCEFIFEVKKAAKFYVSNGNRIIVEPFETTPAPVINLFIHGTAFGILLLQRGFLPIHGSAIVVNGKGVIISGASKAGKSTLSLAFRKKGYSLLSDDIVALSFKNDNSIWIESGFPQQKLWRDSAEINGFDVNSLSNVVEDIDKYFLPVNNCFYDSRCLLTAIFELDVVDDCDKVNLVKIEKAYKLAVLIRQTYRINLLYKMGLQEDHFQKCSEVAKNIPIYRITRPRCSFTTEEQVELILNEIRQK